MQGRLVVIALIAFVLALGLWWLLDGQGRVSGAEDLAGDGSTTASRADAASANQVSPVLRGADEIDGPRIRGDAPSMNTPKPPPAWEQRRGVRLVIRHRDGRPIEKAEVVWLVDSDKVVPFRMPGIPLPTDADFSAARGFLPNRKCTDKKAKILERAPGQLLLDVPEGAPVVGMLVLWNRSQNSRNHWEPKRLNGVRAGQVISVVIDERVSLEVQVVGPTGEPRSNFPLNHKTAWFGRPEGTIWTDGTGRATIPDLPPHAPIYVRPTHGIALPHDRDPDPGSWHMTSDGQVKFVVGSDHGLRVTFEGASSQIRVEATVYIRGQPTRLHGELRRTWVAAGETLWVPNVHPGQRFDLVFRSALGDRSATLTGVVPRKEPYVARLEEGAVLSGTVVGPDGAPIEGADVDLVSGLHRAHTTTGEEGTFEIGGLPNASFRVLVQGWLGKDQPGYKLLETEARKDLRIQIDPSTRPLLVRAEIPKGTRVWRTLRTQVFIDDLPWRSPLHEQRVDPHVVQVELDFIPTEPALIVLNSYFNDSVRAWWQGSTRRELAISARATYVEVDVDVEQAK